MPARNSDSETSTGSSGRINRFNRIPNRMRRRNFRRYRCSGCSQLFSSRDTLYRHQVDSQVTMLGRALLRMIESQRQQPNQPNDRLQDPSPRRRLAPAPAHPHPNPNPSGRSPVPSPFGSMAIVGTYNSNNQPQLPPKEDDSRYHPVPQEPTGPVAEETNGKKTRDLLSLFVEAGAEQASPERTMADQIQKGKQAAGEEANSGTKKEELDLDLKLARP